MEAESSLPCSKEPEQCYISQDWHLNIRRRENLRSNTALKLWIFTDYPIQVKLDTYVDNTANQTAQRVGDIC
jgi:hypothetical protein